MAGEESFPKFDIDILKNLTSISDMLTYLDLHYHVLGEGSSRRAYAVGDRRVIKLALNGKGLAQNGAEIEFGKKQYLVCARIIDYAKDNKFILMERAQPMNDYSPDDMQEFLYYTNIEDYDMFYRFLRICGQSWDKPPNYSSIAKGNKEYQKLAANPWVRSLIKFAQDNDYNLVGDFIRLSSYGVVKRRDLEGSGFTHGIVLVDYGLTQKVYFDHYN